jgi:sulfate permease, SulP family
VRDEGGRRSAASHRVAILEWLPRYDRSWLSRDVIAGLTLWGLVAPEAMAYAGIAGLQPGKYQDIERHPESTPIPGVLVVRIDAPMYYANAQTVYEGLLELVDAADPPPRAIVFDATALDSLDITSAEMLDKLVTKLRADGIELYAAEVHAPVLEFARRTGLAPHLGEDRIFPTVDAAVHALQVRAPDVN